MKKTILLFTALLLNFISFAQENWLPVYPNQKVYFEDIYKTVYCLRIDSTFNENTVLYPFSDLHQIDFECYTINSGSWLSKYIMINEEGNTIFVNGKNQQILIKNKAELNEVWEMFANENIIVKGKITSVSLKSVLGVSDSVKTISFSVYNHNDEPVNHTLNQFSIEISKHFGLVKTVNFYYFEDTPGSYSHLGEFSLIGIHEPQLGFQNINLKEQYFDFQVGDELHIRDLTTGYPQSYHEDKIIQKYLSREDYEDSIVYHYERKMETHTFLLIDGVFQENLYFSIDTLKQQIIKGVLFNTEPNEPYGEESIMKVMIVNNPLLTMYMNDCNFMITEDTCLIPFYVDACNTTPTYYPGLGGHYYPYCQIFGNEYAYELVYYKKGEVEWGTPYNLSVSENKKEHSFSIYPNPTTSEVTINNEQLTINNVEIFDIYGRKHHLITSSSNHLINIAHLPAGIYFLKIYTEAGEVIKKIIKQ